jgi:hypothetical protein
MNKIEEENLEHDRSKHTRSQAVINELEASLVNPNDEDDLRERIDLVDSQANESIIGKVDTQKLTNRNIKRLYDNKRQKEDYLNRIKNLKNKMTGLKKLERKKQQNVRIISQKIESIGERLERGYFGSNS